MKRLIKMFVVIVTLIGLVLCYPVSSFSSSGKVDHLANLKEAEQDMEEIVDELNTSWNFTDYMVQINYLLQALGANGQYERAAVIAFACHLIVADATVCAKTDAHRKKVIQIAEYYKNVRDEMIKFTPRELQGRLLNLLKSEKKYFYSTETRAASFAPYCQNLIKKYH